MHFLPVRETWRVAFLYFKYEKKYIYIFYKNLKKKYNLGIKVMSFFRISTGLRFSLSCDEVSAC